MDIFLRCKKNKENLFVPHWNKKVFLSLSSESILLVEDINKEDLMEVWAFAFIMVHSDWHQMISDDRSFSF